VGAGGLRKADWNFRSFERDPKYGAGNGTEGQGNLFFKSQLDMQFAVQGGV